MLIAGDDDDDNESLTRGLLEGLFDERFLVVALERFDERPDNCCFCFDDLLCPEEEEGEMNTLSAGVSNVEFIRCSVIDS